MRLRFDGGFDALQKLLEDAWIVGTWSEPTGRRCFRSEKGGVLEYWEGTGMIVVRGKDRQELLDALRHATAPLDDEPPVEMPGGFPDFREFR